MVNGQLYAFRPRTREIRKSYVNSLNVATHDLYAVVSAVVAGPGVHP